MPSVEVVIPFAGDCPHRTAALEWVHDQYRAGGYRVTVTEPYAGGVWCKAAAAMPAIQRSRADVVVLADADVWTDGLPAALTALQQGRAWWAIPHEHVHRLTRDATSRAVAGEPWRILDTEERPYRGVWGGGITIAPRQVFLDVPLDPAFTGWGQEDEAWALALHCLHGRPWRGAAPLVHLWHPPQPRDTRRRGSSRSWRRFHEYRRARRDPAAMRRLLHDAQHAPEHAGHHHTPVHR